MHWDVLWPISAMVLFVIGFALVLRHGQRLNAAQEEAWTSATTRLGAERSEQREGIDRYVRIKRGPCEFEAHIALRGTSGGKTRSTSTEYTRFRYRVTPPLPGFLVISQQVQLGAPTALVDALLPMLLGRPLAISTQGIERISLAPDIEAVGHHSMTPRFDSAVIDALRALQSVGRCELIADPAGLVIALDRPLRDAETIVRWFEALDRVGRALDAGAR